MPRSQNNFYHTSIISKTNSFGEFSQFHPTELDFQTNVPGFLLVNKWKHTGVEEHSGGELSRIAFSYLTFPRWWWWCLLQSLWGEAFLHSSLSGSIVRTWNVSFPSTHWQPLPVHLHPVSQEGSPAHAVHWVLQNKNLLRPSWEANITGTF